MIKNLYKHINHCENHWQDHHSRFLLFTVTLVSGAIMLLLFASELGYYLTTEVWPYCCHIVPLLNNLFLGNPGIICRYNSRGEASNKHGCHSLSYSLFL